MVTLRSVVIVFLCIFAFAIGVSTGDIALTKGSGLAQPLSSTATAADGWRSGGPYDSTMTPIPVADVAVSSAYTAGGTIFAATAQGVYRSTDRGQSWQAVLQGAAGHDVRFTHVRLSPTYAQDGTVFAAYVDETDDSAGLYKSTDRGATWTPNASVGEVRALAISLAYATDQTLFVGRMHSIWKSTDGGATWTEHPLMLEGEGFDIFDLVVSPNYAADQTLFATGYGPARRSSDGGVTWQEVDGYAPAYDVVISPNYADDGRVWATYRAIEAPGDGTPESGVFRSTNRGDSWQLTSAGLPGVYEPYPRHLGVSPAYAADQTLFTALSGQFVAEDEHSLYRSVNGGDSWVDLGTAPANPDVFGIAVTASTGEGVVAHVATSAGVWHYVVGNCEERVADGGFEAGGVWALPTTAHPAGYSTSTVHTGTRSLRTGITDGADVLSYSSGVQTVTIPGDAISATLTLWWYPLSAEGDLPPAEIEQASAPFPVAEETSPAPRAPAAGDRQYILLLDEQGDTLQTLWWTRSNAAAWQQLHFDLSAYAGRIVRLHLGVYNNGNGQKTAMYVDDVSLIACRRGGYTQYLPLLHKDSTGAPTATPTLTPTPFPTPTATAPVTTTPVALQMRWLRSLVVEPGENGRLLGITNEGRLVASSDRGANWTYLALPNAIAGAPLQGRGTIGMDYNDPDTLYIGARQQGLWRSTDGGATWSQVSPIKAGPVAVSFDDASILWAGIPWDEVYRSVVVRSDDAGESWQAAGSGLGGEVASPILIDPAAPARRYLITEGERGGATLWRSTDGSWEKIEDAPVGTPPSGGPGLGLALDTGNRSLYVASNAGTLSVSRNFFASNVADITWTTVHAFSGGYLPIPLAVGSGPQDSALYLSLYDWFSGQGRTLRSDDEGVTWTLLTIPPIGVPPGVDCYDGIANGGFEEDTAWVIRANPAPAGYVNSPVHSGGRSMRTGIAAGGTNLESYSPVEQSISIPALPSPGISSTVQLRFWRYNVYGDVVYGDTSARGEAQTAETLADLPRTEADLQTWSAPADFFYAIVIRGDGSTDWLLRERINDPRWREAVMDLSQYAGQTIRLQFGTYNNGTGGISRTYIDDVSLPICPPADALLLPKGWSRRVIGRPERDTLYTVVGDLLYRSDDAGVRWRISGTARPEQMVMGGDPDVLYAGDGYPCYMGGPPVPMWRSTDGGATWQQVPAGQNLKPLALHADRDWIYAAGCNGSYLSKDGAAVFAHQPDPLFGVYDVHFIEPVGSAWETVWIGGISEGGGGAVLVSRNSGASWPRSTPMELETGWLGDLALDRFQAGRIYTAAYYGFFSTDDDGATWQANSQGLEDVIGGDPPAGLFAIAQDPSGADHRLYLGTARGLYVRDPGSGEWTKISGEPFDSMEVTALLIVDSAPDRIYVTTPFGVFIYGTAEVSN